MEPIAITEEMAADSIGGTVVTFAAPPGEEDTVNAVQGLFEIGVGGRFGPDRIHIPWRPDEEELAALNAGDPVWLVVFTHRMPVVQLYVQALPGEEYVALVGGPHDGRAVLRKDVRAERGLEPRIQMEDAAYELSGASYYFVEPDGTDPVPEVGS
jgi:hypothetical protein